MKLNDLSGRAWMKLSKSVYATQKSFTEIKARPFSLQNPYLFNCRRNTTMPLSDTNENIVKLIELFTKEDELVFDFLVNSNAVELAAKASNRQFMNKAMLVDNECVAFDSISLLLSQCSNFDLTRGNEYYDIELCRLNCLLNRYYSQIKLQGHVILLVSDQRHQGAYYDIHSDIAEVLRDAGFLLQGIIVIIDENKKLNAYGYPTTFVPNIVHQYAVIAKKI